MLDIEKEIEGIKRVEKKRDNHGASYRTPEFLIELLRQVAKERDRVLELCIDWRLNSQCAKVMAHVAGSEQVTREEAKKEIIDQIDGVKCGGGNDGY